MCKLKYFFLIFIFYACEKDKNDNPNLFVNLLIDNETFFYSETDSNYFDAIYQSSSIGRYQYGGGFKNNNYRIENLQETIYDQISIRFHNIPFDSIVIGEYELIGQKNYNMTINKGVELIWMDSDNWKNLNNKYISSQEYKDCQDLNPNFNCLNNLNEYYFFVSSDEINENRIKITNSYLKDYEVYSANESLLTISTDLIIEGTIPECILRSRIDTSITKTIKGNFKIHLPSPKPLNLNVNGQPCRLN